MKSKSREQIIADQESIGNVKITEEQYGLIKIGSGEIQISLLDEDIYFAPRDVVYPKEKQDVKDNHSSEIKAHVESKDEEPEQVGLCSRESNSSGSDNQLYKIFEDEILKEVMQDKINMELFTLDQNIIIQEVIRKTIKLTKEKWGKIEK